MTGPSIILATSAARPEYKRDFLTCLASPDGHRVAFSYKKSWFENGLLDTVLTGRSATIVFCDVKSPAVEFDFVAFRRGCIVEIVPSSTAGLREDSAIVVVFELERLVAVTDGELEGLSASWNGALGVLDHRPRPDGHPEQARARFVFEHQDLDESAVTPDQRQSWRALSEHLGQYPALGDAFFFRVDGVRKPTDSGIGKALQPASAGSLRHVYSLAPYSEYEIALDAYSKSGKNPYSEAITAISSSDKLTVQAITQSSAGRASQAVLLVRAGEVYRPQLATLIIKGAEDFEHVVPRVELAARIKPNLTLALALTFVIALGVVMGGLPKDALGLSDLALYAVKFTGGLIVGGVTFVALGRVPGIGK